MMMEEADHQISVLHSSLADTECTESVICDALQDAAQTYVTESMHQSWSAVASPVVGTSGNVLQLSSSFSAPSPVLSAGPIPLSSNMSLTSPSALPPQLMAEFSPTKRVLQNIPVENTPSGQPSLPPSSYNFAGSVGMMNAAGIVAPTLPPPPTMGFVPVQGVVTGNPSKYHNVMSSVPTDTATHIMTPTAAAVPGPATEDVMNGSYTSAALYNKPVNTTFSPSYGHAMNLPHELPTTSYPSYAAVEQPPTSPQKSEGFFGWLPGSGLMHKVIEKTKSSVESVITTLDPGMKEVIYSGGYINIVVTSTKEVKVGAVREAFQTVFGRATVFGVESQPTIAPQPVGYSSGVRGAEERIENLRQSGAVDENQVLVSAENFIVELLPDRWFDIGCIILKDPRHNIELTTFSQATPVPAECICMAQDATPSDYALRWSGLAMTVGQAFQRREPYVDHSDWHAYYTGVSRRAMLSSAARSIAGLYRSKLISLGYSL